MPISLLDIKPTKWPHLQPNIAIKASMPAAEKLWFLKFLKIIMATIMKS